MINPDNQYSLDVLDTLTFNLDGFDRPSHTADHSSGIILPEPTCIYDFCDEDSHIFFFRK